MVELWPPPVVRRKDRVWLHVLLVLLTLVTTTLAGVDHYLAFRNTFATPSLSLSLVVHGLVNWLLVQSLRFSPRAWVRAITAALNRPPSPSPSVRP